MKIGYLIGALNAGGSERQLSELAIGMSDKGHQIEIFCYDGAGFFDDYVRSKGIALHRLHSGSKFKKFKNTRTWLKSFNPDILHGFMKRASSLAVLAKITCGLPKVVASDFSTATFAPNKPDLRLALFLYHFADRVATQTEVNRANLAKLSPWIKNKIVIVRNGVDTSRFQPCEKPQGSVFRFLVVGTIWRAKNPVNVVRAVKILRQKCSFPFHLKWVGRYHRGAEKEVTKSYQAAKDLVQKYSLSEVISFAGQTQQVEKAYHEADALLHASIQEGMPNAVVEAMASGLPVVVSRVSDLPLIIEKGRNGFDCDAFDPENMASAMKRMLEANIEERQAMGRRSRELAELWFGRERFLNDYEKIYTRILGGEN